MITYVVCPKCGHANAVSANQCVECGIKLSNETLEASKEDTIFFQSQTAAAIAGVNLHVNLALGEVAFYLVEAWDFMRFKYVKPILLGRDDQPHSSNVQFVDLAAYNAYVRGMSRHHALIQRANGKYYITDMESSNGIVVDGYQIAQNHSHLLESGALVFLGKFGMVFQCA